MYANLDWPKLKMRAGLFSALALLTVSLIGFSVGLQFGGEYGWIVGPLVWSALTIVQFIGNDSKAHDDFIFTVGWLFTYVLGIGASTWAMYTFINIPNENLRWVIAAGLGGSIEVLPERLIYKFISTLNKPKTQYQPQQQPLHGVNSRPSFANPGGVFVERDIDESGSNHSTQFRPGLHNTKGKMPAPKRPVPQQSQYRRSDDDMRV